MTRYLLSAYWRGYLVAEEDELAQDGEGLQVLRKCPEVVSHERAVERRMEERCEHGSGDDEVVGFDCIEIAIVAGLEAENDAVEDISRQR